MARTTRLQSLEAVLCKSESPIRVTVEIFPRIPSGEVITSPVKLSCSDLLSVPTCRELGASACRGFWNGRQGLEALFPRGPVTRGSAEGLEVEWGLDLL